MSCISTTRSTAQWSGAPEHRSTGAFRSPGADEPGTPVDPEGARRWMASTRIDRPHLPDGSSPEVLLVGDNRQRSRLEERLRNRAGYRVVTVSTGREALSLLHSWMRSALILIHRMSDLTPAQFCQQLFSLSGKVPQYWIVVADEGFDAEQAVAWLRAGADDYISGPHLEDERVFLARLEALLRTHRVTHEHTTGEEATELIVVGNMAIDPVKFRVTVDNRPCDLTRLQFHLLYALARRPEEILSHSRLRAVITKCGGNPDQKTVKSHIYHLRQRLGDAGRRIRTVRGMGYQFCE